jgi:hypothetical protein
MLRTRRVVKNKFPRKKRNIKRETRKETKINYSRKVSTQRKIVPHQMKLMIVTVTRKMYSSWLMKMMKRITKNKVR